MQSLISPIIYNSKVELPKEEPLSSAKLLELMNWHRGYVAHKLGLDLAATARNEGIAFYLQQVVIENINLKTQDTELTATSSVPAFTESPAHGTRVAVNFEFKDKRGELVAKGEALYVTVDTNTGKPRPLPQQMWNYFSQNEVTPTISEEKLKLFEIKDAEKSNLTFTARYEIQPEDIDFYNHVTSSAYIKYIEKSLKRAPWRFATVRKISIQFLGSLKSVGAGFCTQLNEIDPHVVHAILTADNGKSIVKASIGLI